MDLSIPSQLLIAVFFSIAGNNEQLNNSSWFLQRSCKTNPLGGAEMKKGGAIYDQIMQTEPSRKMPPPFYGPQPNNLQETIYYQHGFPLVSAFQYIIRTLLSFGFSSIGYRLLLSFKICTKKVGNFEKSVQFLAGNSNSNSNSNSNILFRHKNISLKVKLFFYF